MEKLKYEFDPHNRLTVKNTSLRGIRKVIEGQFKISEYNTLVYEIKTSAPSSIKAPHQVKLKGAWSLTEGHRLRIALDKWRRESFGDQITLQGEIMDVRQNSLLFMVTSKTKDGTASKYILELSGSWRADDHNRLTFRINKEHDRFDVLTFDGAWDIDENYQIRYVCQEAQRARKDRETHELIFTGHWNIKDRARLSYIIDSGTASGFDFNTSIGIFKDNYIKYELGIGLSHKKRPVRRTITFSGKWKVRKGIGLVFEFEQGGGRIQAIVFGAEARLSDKGSVSFSLRNNLNKEMGVELELSRDVFSGGGQAFLRLLKSKQESAILVGAGWKW